jgi:hypothetical protein
MLTIEKTVLPSPDQWEIVIEGTRNPMNSWDRMDSYCGFLEDELPINPCDELFYFIGENDRKLMMSLNKGGTEHSKYRRMIPVWVTINAPLYWWKEADTYTVGKVQNSCSTMHKIHSKEFTLDDFSHEHLVWEAKDFLGVMVGYLNSCRENYLANKDKKWWWQMIQMLPTSYNQKRTVFFNYEVLAKIYRERKNHKLDEWHTFCDWIKTLPYSELITMEE